MATWQQGNSGSFLAGIGSNNTNAPQASDINATLGMIRDNNDRARAGENNLGMQLANATGSIFNSWKQGQQQQRQGEFQKAYAGAYASGDRGAMRQLAAQYPEQFEAVQKGMGFIDDDQRNTVGSLAASARLAAQSPETMGKWLQSNAGELARAGVNPADVATMYQQNPQGFGEFADHLGMAAIGPEKYFEFQDKAVGRDIDRGKLAEQVRSNKAGEGLQARGQDIQIRGQNISAQNAARSAGGSTPASVREYQYFNSLSPEQQKTYLRVRGRPDAGGDNTVQLADGRTVSVSGKLHGSGANAFYEGIDDSGNMVRVPASAIAAPATSAANAQNYAMKKDIDTIANADSNQLDFMTGMTGGTGSPALGADVRSRITGNKEQRQLYNATRRIQGRMQNQGVAAAKDMGASGINTIAEAKLYFQSMPQLDYSSPEAMQQSLRDIQEYTDIKNKEYELKISGKKSQLPTEQSQQAPAPQQQAGFSSLWGE
ncbi:phage DNA ejection protein [Serratia sp. JSRIV004]|uniref:phage DNA ejection protein n=1 Tax=Serratia sp. JSRIV004 TaxID=2831895 RepID=UPI001CC11367|nr:phage DNA ejection protein [Serratia sp. JSRIV004]UAN59650.1 phage DNA ejection protein [Serratia sp. JSRIV004]